ncbi:MAG: hypothetical protein U0599_15270 [Vicinamibacteria bacterium]
MTDLHLHVWGWEIPVYLFPGGFTAGIMVLSGWALWKGRRNPHGEPTFARLERPLPDRPPRSRSAWAPFFLDLGHKLYVWRSTGR